MQNKYYCILCQNAFDDPYVVYQNAEHFGTPCEIEHYLCPKCKDSEYVELKMCSECGCPIEGDYIVTASGKEICNNCIWHKNINDK